MHHCITSLTYARGTLQLVDFFNLATRTECRCSDWNTAWSHGLRCTPSLEPDAIAFTVSTYLCVHVQVRNCLLLFLQISQRDILNSIDREMSGDLREGFKTVGKGST